MAAGGRPRRDSKATAYISQGYGFYSDGRVLSREVMCPKLHFGRHALTPGFRIASRAELEWKQGFQVGGYDQNPIKIQEDRSKKWSDPP